MRTRKSRGKGQRRALSQGFSWEAILGSGRFRMAHIIVPLPSPSQDVSAPFDGSSCPLSNPVTFHCCALSTPHSPPRYLLTQIKILISDTLLFSRSLAMVSSSIIHISVTWGMCFKSLLLPCPIWLKEKISSAHPRTLIQQSWVCKESCI